MASTDVIGSSTDAATAAAAAAATAAKTNKTSSAAASASLSSDINFFLTMLTTQLKNQDPTAPMDVAQMTQQIAQYSGVEQQVKTNANLETLISSNKQSQLSTAVSYIGKEVETAGTSGQVVAGQGAFTYILPKAAKEAKITITDSKGAAVFTGTGTVKEGRNLVVWDGVNSFTGKQMPDGMYTLAVKATDSDGTSMTPTIRSVGIISGVENDKDGNITMNIGDTTIKYSDILAVRSPTRAATTTDDTTT